MNKKEINEIKSLFLSADENGIERLVGCYVDGERNIVSSFNNTFLNLDKEEIYKYLEIFTKSLSGTQGKNLLDMTFAYNGQNSDGAKLLESMRMAELKDDILNSLFFDKVIETYDCVGPYLILLIYQAYDVPGITEDGIEMGDASDEVYSYILCSLCPVGVTKPGLGYFEETNDFHSLKQEKYVLNPDNAFLYPAFNDRCADTDSILYYTQKGENPQIHFLEEFLGVDAPVPAAEQKETFSGLIKETFAEEADMNVVTSVHENLAGMVSEKKKLTPAGQPVVIDRDDVTSVMRRSGVDEERVRHFSERYDEEFGGYGQEPELYAANIMPARSKLEMKTPDVVVKINYDKTSLVETRVIDGKRCLVIELGEGLVVNGIPVQY